MLNTFCIQIGQSNITKCISEMTAKETGKSKSAFLNYHFNLKALAVSTVVLLDNILMMGNKLCNMH